MLKSMVQELKTQTLISTKLNRQSRSRVPLRRLERCDHLLDQPRLQPRRHPFVRMRHE